MFVCLFRHKHSALSSLAVIFADGHAQYYLQDWWGWGGGLVDGRRKTGTTRWAALGEVRESWELASGDIMVASSAMPSFVAGILT